MNGSLSNDSQVFAGGSVVWLRVAARGTCVLAALLGAWVTAGFLRVAWRRLSFPFDLEWMEGGMLLHVARVLDGKPLYAEPAPEFMPFLYAPGYTYVCAIAAKVFSLKLLSLRLVSLLATIANFGILFGFVRADTGRVFPAVMSVSLFAGTFPLSGAWFDLARVDSLALAFALGAVLTARLASRNYAFGAAGLLAAAAVLTKQSMLVVLLPLLACSFLRGRFRGALISSAVFLVATVGVGLWFQITSHGWFWYYVAELPATHGMKGRESLIAGFWRDEFSARLSVAATCALFVLCGFPLQLRRSARLVHAVLAVSLIAGAYASRLHMGSYVNDVMPAHAALALLFGLGLHGLAPADTATSAGLRRTLACGLVAIAQLALLTGDLDQYLPRHSDYVAGQRVVDRIRRTPGDVLVVNHPELALLSGKKPYAHQMAYIDVYYAERDPRNVRDPLRNEWRALFSNRRFSMVILDSDWYVFLEELERNYRRDSRIEFRKDALLPKTGTSTRPELVFVPRRRVE